MAQHTRLQWSEPGPSFVRPTTDIILGCAHRSFALEWQQHADTTSANVAALSTASASHYNRSAPSLRPLRLGDHVDVKDPRTKLWNACGVIVGVGRLRDYLVKLTNGRVYWRNRCLLRPLVPAVQSSRSVPAAHRPASPPCRAAPRGRSQSPARCRSTQPTRSPHHLNISSTSGQSYD